MKTSTLFLIVTIGAIALLSCTVDDANTDSMPAPVQSDTGVFPSTAEAILFIEKCAMCHRHNGMGTGLLARRLPKDQALLENRADLTAILIQTAVRHGVGTMPRISRAEVSDIQLRKIEHYLLRQAGGDP